MKPKEVHFANFAACRASFLLIATTCFPYPLASTMPPHVFEQCCSRAPAHVIPLRAVNLQIGCVSRNKLFQYVASLGAAKGCVQQGGLSPF